ncbi:hypothetical protein SDRG_00524 [Saprolegnia diclina VS20]|uniref:Glycosyltransferase 2-like domain-containing protein n=1 Tax=Saprolegnia diclina (strain VS20) TaxID=1156394 RepID=T0SBK5_SAPDV|nr:hypothetical protein SDRG_00524 [Saprolegnia diclina VS20]EQC42803.1 hypothetical protein SDRG_00524 [Saprolegnia diclina VS20]|eukprot:XP_008604226.1 hypothetical protein SDRG_00524 [Saprolegnia diclina VS20]
MKLLHLLSVVAVLWPVTEAGPELSVRDHNKNKTASKRPTIRVPLDPSTQHTPVDPALAHLRPPAPRFPAEYDMFVGLSAFRDGARCGYTVFTGFSRATRPDKLYFGIVDQLLEADLSCIDAYCALAAEAWPKWPCKYRDQIRIDSRDAAASRGPTYARHFQQDLVRDEEFCLQLDAHSEFTTQWDTLLVQEWQRTENEMAVLTTYLHNIDSHILSDGTNLGARTAPHICQTTRGGSGNVRNVAADLIYDSERPQLGALWGAGLSFSKCHAEKRVLIDSHTLWMFDGEEFLRASHLWTHGYDLYSPSTRGLVVYHNYTSVPAKYFDLRVDMQAKHLETARANNRVKYLVGVPFVGEIDAEELDIYGWGTVRSFAAYLNYSGLVFEPNVPDKQSCKQLHWVPYEDASAIEALLPGWTPATVAPPTAAMRKPASMRRQKGVLPSVAARQNESSALPAMCFLALILAVFVALLAWPRTHLQKTQ